MKKILTILFLLISFQLYAQHYWVDNTGTGDTLATMTEVNALTLGADDTVSFKCGCIWREKLTVPNSGTEGHYLVFNSYGTGDRPKIYVSQQATSFTNVSGNIWGCTNDVDDPFAGVDIDVWFELTTDTVIRGNHQTYTVNFSNLTEEYDWTWNANHVYVYAASDPDSRYSAVEAGQPSANIDLNSQEYVEISGLDLRYGWGGVDAEYPTAGLTGFKMNNCYIGHSGNPDGEGSAIGVVYNDMLIEYDTIIDQGRRGISVVNYGTHDITNIVIQYCAFYVGWHTTGLDLETGSNLGDTGDLDSIFFRNNLVYDYEDAPAAWGTTESNFIQGPHPGPGQILGLYFYNNIIMFTSSSGLQLEDVDGAYVYNNTFYGHNMYATATDHIDVYEECTNIHIKNNIFYTDLNREANGSGIEAVIADNVSEVDMDYNLYWRINDGYRIAIHEGSANYYRTVASFNSLRSDYGYEVNSPYPADPLFINTTDPMEPDSLMIGDSSPADSAGIGLGIIYDYRDSTRGTIPSIGAFEANPIPTDEPPDLPTILTTIPLYHSSRSSTGGGNVTDDGGGTISAKGIVWSYLPNPDLTDTKTINGTGEGLFTSWIGIHNQNDTIHVRAYGTNETGTSYGADESFIVPASIFSPDSITFDGTTYFDSLNFVNDSLILRTTTGKRYKIKRYTP